MTTTVVLALAATAGGGPACLLAPTSPGGGPALTRIVRTARRHGPVHVLTRAAWEDGVRAAVEAAAAPTATGDAPAAAGDDVAVVVVAGGADALHWLVARAPIAVTEAAPGVRNARDGLSVVQAHLVSDPVGLTAVLDGAAGSCVLAAALDAHAEPQGGPGTSDATAVQGGPGTSDATAVKGGPLVRCVRGRVVASSSPAHRVASPTHRVVGGLHLTARAVVPALDGAATLATEAAAGRLPDDPDVLAWLLVAAVRSGAPVSATPVPRRGYAELVRTSGEAATALQGLDRLDVDAVRLDASVKPEDGFFTTFLVSSYSTRIVRVAERVGLTPDAVTGLSMLLGAGAAGAFATGRWGGMLLGALLLQAAFTLDCVDGQLARATRRFTVRGAWLDSIFDRGKEYLVYAGLAVGGIVAGDDRGLWLLAGAALALQTVRHTLDLGYAAQQASDVQREVRRPLLDLDDHGPGFWEVGHAADAAVAPGGTEPPPERARRRRSARRAVLALRRAEDVAALRWAKRIVVLPIGERFALISVLAVVASPRVVFLALLVWGGFATVYTAGGRVVRSLA